MRKIKQLSAEQRPRERLMNLGAEQLSDAELLAIFLRVGVVGKSAIELADELIENYSLDGVFKLEPQQVKGIGIAKIAQIRATLELTKRYLETNPKALGEKVISPQVILQKLKLQLKHLKKEVFLIVFMNNQNQIISIEQMFQGTINQTAVYTREIIKKCLELDATAIIASHNHPSGDITPSKQDIHLTKKLKSALELIEVRLLDHIIIGGNSHYSFAENNTL
jgi:DNA repair protein RadC